MSARILILPGLYDSGPQHWQSRWQARFPQMSRVEQADWQTPVCNDWVERLEQVVALDAEQVVLVAHSLACVLVARWAERYPRRIRGALLVAPSDTEGPNFPTGTSGFQPMPGNHLPFPSIVVVSSEDPYAELSRSERFAADWGAELVNIGPRGHINGESGLGDWPEGLALLARLCGEPLPG
ncbi:RBBP9/YdeN family alpha/beta hydrolase [Chitinimonas lacunae]|uniref:RBBP9/YdeN family alpha/beta hydrolase n=1 Tax=Chitinimonas lacunae TaxID=1963018 RepID=A0ABV8MVK7_9NEIS